MEWTPDIAARIARTGCFECTGRGVLQSAPPRLCNCIYRTVFRACHHRFRRFGREAHMGISTVRTMRAVDSTLSWSRQVEDFRADFHAAGLRALPKHLYHLFSFHHLHGASQELVGRRLGLSPARTAEWIAEIELLLGREIAHMKPYSIFPPPGYRIPPQFTPAEPEWNRRIG